MKGIPEFDIYVRFCETDAAGHVNNASYFFYLEEARMKFFDVPSFHEIQVRENLSFIVASVNCDFLKQAYAKQILTVTTEIKRVGTKSFNVENRILLAETRDIIAIGSATVVCFNFETQKSVTIPSELRSILEQYLMLNKENEYT